MNRTFRENAGALVPCDTAAACRGSPTPDHTETTALPTATDTEPHSDTALHY